MPHDVTTWLEKLGLGQYAEAFEDNDIGWSTLPELNHDLLREIGVKSVGHRVAILKAIKSPAAEPEGAGEEPFVPPPPTHAAEAERRQLTVMFCDLVGSTTLAERIDPEEYREVLSSYQSAARRVIESYDGYIARYMGDGLLVYFGYPQAHEDDAERAVRAGLEIVNAVGSLDEQHGTDLQVRIGVATGLVVVGDIVGEGASEERAVLGETPNLAARLQGIASFDEVVLSETTRRLIENRFELDSLGKQTLKGITGKVPAYRALSVRAEASRFEAAHPGKLSTMVGREEEIDLLVRRWQQAEGGEGQVVLLSGEAGIGKSRIVETLSDRIGAYDPIRLRFQCSPYHANSAAYPFITHLEQTSSIAPSDGTGARLDKLEELLARSTADVARIVPLLGALLSVPTDDRYPPIELTPQVQKERTLDALGDYVVGLSERQPVLIIFEDMHWADPTTLEALELVFDKIRSTRVLGVITFRPEFKPPWHSHPHVTALALNRLGGNLCAAMVANVAHGKPLPDEVLNQIVAKTDGVPLFVEELTKTVIESGILEEKVDRFELTAPLPPLAIPSTLQDSLMARIDRFTSVKKVAQIGAVIGREFSHQLLTEISDARDDELDTALHQLVETELVFRRGKPPDATYVFKHALVQDAAYESLLRRKRQELHEDIARGLERRFPDTVETEPEIIAHHYTRAGIRDGAIPYWLKAGQHAAQRSANVEAIAHFSEGLALLEGLPESLERDKLELEFRIALGPVQMAAHGVSSESAEQTYNRVQTLAERIGDPDSMVGSRYGVWQVTILRGDVEKAGRIARETLAATEGSANSGHRLQAHHMIWPANLFGGNPETTYEHSCSGVEIYDENEHRAHKFLYGGHDPGACGYVFKGLASWFLGYPDRGLEAVTASVSMIEKLAHPMSGAFIYWFATVHRHLRREPGETERLGTMGVELCAENGIAAWSPAMASLRGWARGELGEDDATAEIEAGMQAWQASGHNVFRPWFLALLAEADGRSGRAKDGIRKTEEGLAHSARYGEHWFDAEIHRVRGQLMLARSARNKRDAEAEFHKAIDVARTQKAKSLELRAATRLARLLGENKRRAEAHAHLSTICDWFTEGFDTADLRDAKALVNELE